MGIKFTMWVSVYYAKKQKIEKYTQIGTIHQLYKWMTGFTEGVVIQFHATKLTPNAKKLQGDKNHEFNRIRSWKTEETGPKSRH